MGYFSTGHGFGILTAAQGPAFSLGEIPSSVCFGVPSISSTGSSTYCSTADMSTLRGCFCSTAMQDAPLLIDGGARSDFGGSTGTLRIMGCSRELLLLWFNSCSCWELCSAPTFRPVYYLSSSFGVANSLEDRGSRPSSFNLRW